METKSTQKHIRISPRKVKIVLDLISEVRTSELRSAS